MDPSPKPTPAPSNGHGGGGGGWSIRLTEPETVSGVVLNQQLLVLPVSLGAVIDGEVLKRVTIVQLEFARDVSRLAADAYEKLAAATRDQAVATPPT